MKLIVFSFLMSTVSLFCQAQPAAGDINGRGLSFAPDYAFKGSALTGWKPMGDARWSAANGEITGSGGQAGWLLYEKSFQDIGVNMLIKLNGAVEAGILLRAEKTASGTKGVLVLIRPDSSGAYAVTLDGNGKILSREKLRNAGGMIRIAPPPSAENSGFQRPGANQQRTGGPALPIQRPQTAYKPGDWNQLELILDMNILRGFINDGAGPGGATDSSEFGPVALYVSGPGSVIFKDLKYKDLALRYTPKEQSSPRFEVQQLSDYYYSWSASAADFNKDGVMDIVAGPYIYYGPGYTNFREIYPGFALNPSKEFTDVNCQYSFDFNNDGWTDVFVGPPFGRLYINPKTESRRWDVYSVIPGNINSEVTVFTDLDGDKRPELVYGTNSQGKGVLRYAKFDPADPTKPWKAHIVSEPGYFTAHGIGAGDINDDGRMDIINPYGWWEQPATPADAVWAYHPQAFARYGHRGTGFGGSVMAVYDVNGDKLNDVVTSLNAHGFGLAWFEQKKAADGNISFVRHMIMDDFSAKNAGNLSFSELHGSTFADIDGDGITDFIVGKRYFSHVDTYLDPDPFGAPVLYWFRTVRNPKAPGGAEFVPELVHNRSGAGSDVLAVDLNNDGAIDIVSSTNRGTFIFWNRKKN
jgi:hypothetical protein